MSLTRREFLKLGGLTATALTATSCSVAGRRLAQLELSESPLLPPPHGVVGSSAGRRAPGNQVDLARRFMNRAGYGARPGDMARLVEKGFEETLEEQLDPDEIEDTAAELIVRNLNVYHMDSSQLIDQEPRDVAIELATATLGRAVYSKRQLYEAMVEFWSDHFNVYVRKNRFLLPLKAIDDRDVIRPHALGNFRDLLFASARSPAMLVYLDNVRNLKESPNENYARELMELHAMGVDSGYTQQDVEEVARALTGWGVQRRGPRQGQFHFDARQHDQGAKRILGQALPAGQGQGDVIQSLEILANHPATATFIAGKLVRRFVADSPPAGLVERVARRFGETQGDIRGMLRLIFSSEEFALAPPKLKRPYSYLISSLRALNADVRNYRGLIRWLERLGQLPFHWAAPNGYPDGSTAWAANLLPRWNFGLALLGAGFPGGQEPGGWLPGVRLPLDTILELSQANDVEEALDFFARLILGRSLDDEERLSFLDYVGSGPLDGRRRRQRLAEAIALMLASPGFQWT